MEYPGSQNVLDFVAVQLLGDSSVQSPIQYIAVQVDNKSLEEGTKLSPQATDEYCRRFWQAKVLPNPTRLELYNTFANDTVGVVLEDDADVASLPEPDDDDDDHHSDGDDDTTTPLSIEKSPFASAAACVVCKRGPAAQKVYAHHVAQLSGRANALHLAQVTAKQFLEKQRPSSTGGIVRAMQKVTIG